jgi:TLC ATP/ADP transporter
VQNAAPNVCKRTLPGVPAGAHTTHIAAAVQVKLWIDRNVSPPEGAADEKKGKKKKSGSLRESWATLRGSPKIMNLALIVICYALSHRLFEFAWKGQLRVLFPTAKAYSGALADVAIYTGTAPAPLARSGAHLWRTHACSSTCQSTSSACRGLGPARTVHASRGGSAGGCAVDDAPAQF